MAYADRSFDQLIWPRPTNTAVDWFEMAAILTPRGEADPWHANPSVRAAPVASATAVRRLVLLSYAHRISVRIVETSGQGRRTAVRRDAYFEGVGAPGTRRKLVMASRRLHHGAPWLDSLHNPAGAALALWRANLLSNGLIRNPKAAMFSVRVPTSVRGAALQAAAEALGLESLLIRKIDGLRLQLDPVTGSKLLHRLLEGSALESFL
jgi:hypothetical protein